MQNIHLLSYTVHVTATEGGNYVTLFFKQLQCFVGELESAVQGEAMLFLLKSNETISTWAYELF